MMNPGGGFGCTSRSYILDVRPRKDFPLDPDPLPWVRGLGNGRLTSMHDVCFLLGILFSCLIA